MPLKKQKKKNNKTKKSKTHLDFRIQMIEMKARDRLEKEKSNPTWATSDYRNENDVPFDFFYKWSE